jgi:cytoskeleton protein RodZ
MTEPAAQDTSANAAASTMPNSPGAMLRIAREKAGLTAEDLGGQLKLAKGTLEALERDDFAALSEPVYVRGYYRKIAKLLPVSEKALIEAYNARSKPARAVVSAAPSRIPLAGGVAAGASSRFPYAGVMLVLAAVAVAVVMFIFVDRETPRRIATPETGAPAAVTVPAPTPVETAPAQTAPAQSAPAQAAPTAAPAPAAAAPAPAVLEAPPAVANQLVLNFSESSFVRVEDSRGKTLAIGLVRAGEKQALDGAPPYTVFLGNARNVKVYFNGQPVDFSAHVNAQNDTARFMVP